VACCVDGLDGALREEDRAHCVDWPSIEDDGID
jgi:hypothetical protein